MAAVDRTSLGEYVTPHLYGVVLQGARVCKNTALDIKNWIKTKGCRSLDASSSYQQIGKGAFGSVFSIRTITDLHSASKCDLVVKQIKYNQQIGREETIEEARIQQMAADLHGIAVKVWYYFECNDAMYIIMDRLPPGRTLYKTRAMQAGYPPSDHTLIAKVLKELTKLHNMGYIHGDLHGDNIWVTDMGDPLLVDFGYAQPIHTVINLSRTPERNIEAIKLKIVGDHARLMWATTSQNPKVVSEPADPEWVRFFAKMFGWELANHRTINRFSTTMNRMQYYDLWDLYLASLGLPPQPMR